MHETSSAYDFFLDQGLEVRLLPAQKALIHLKNTGKENPNRLSNIKKAQTEHARMNDHKRI